MGSAASAVAAMQARGASAEPHRLAFKADGTFKIAQFTDTHFRSDKDFSFESVNLIGETLDAEKPDLVVFTGDIVTSGNDVFKDWDLILAPCIERKTPWAVVLGNHDHERGKSNKQIIEHIQGKPHSVTQAGPADIKGWGNYPLEIHDGDRLAHVLWCLDSNAYSKQPGAKGYDWFGADQIAWYRKTAAAYAAGNGGKPVPALAFFHIPLCEFGEMIHFKSGKSRVVGDRGENECPGALNPGMFLAMIESGDVMGVFCGHDHVNDYVGLWRGVALGYGWFSGTKTTYTRKNEPHGSRLFELRRDGGRTFKTWVRLRGGEALRAINVPADITDVKKT
jgi:3',5'-cyclic AMP phosphodiesterase CpdA